MKKPYKHTALSKVPCKDCCHLIKANVIARKPTAIRCFSCHRKAEALRGHKICMIPRAKRIAAHLPTKKYKGDIHEIKAA